MEISKPRIVVLLVITAVASMYAASRIFSLELTYINVIHIIVAGSFASAGSSALNHYYDRDIDHIMTRTNKRPIQTGRIKANYVLVYGLIVNTFSIIYAIVFINITSTLLILTGMFFYVFIYTIWLKRRHFLSIVIGGFAGSAASMAGWTSITGSIDLFGFLIGMLVFVWTPSHFWCLAMKIKDDYAAAKVPMLPVILGMKKTSKYIFINTIILIPYSVLLCIFGLGILYLIVASISGGLMLFYHYKLTKNPSSEFAWKSYKITAPYLTIIFAGIVADTLINFKI